MKYNGIAISGPLRSGKDTLAAALMNQNKKYVRVAFADELKKIACELTRDNMFNEQTKIKHRPFLIALGQAMRQYDGLFWVRKAQPLIFELIQNHKLPIITDLRFKNEAEELRSMGFLLIRLECSEEELIIRGWTPNFKQDPSEAELNNYENFHLKLNSGNHSPEELAKQVKDFLEAKHE